MQLDFLDWVNIQLSIVWKEKYAFEFFGYAIKVGLEKEICS